MEASANGTEASLNALHRALELKCVISSVHNLC